MNLQISSSGRVCLCEYRGPVTSTMVVSLWSHLKRTREVESEPALLILELDPAAAMSIARGFGPFLGALPALRDCCRAFVVVIEGNLPIANQLRRTLAGCTLTPTNQQARPLRCCESLDEAFSHAQALFPHSVLELQRRRLRGKALSLGA